MNTQLLGVQATRYNLMNMSVYKNILPNPDKIIQKRYGDVRVYDDLLNDAHIKSCIQSRFAPTLSREISITGNNPDQVNFVKKIFAQLKLRRIIEEALEAVLYGYKPLEIYWRYIDGFVVPVDVVGKPSWWFHFDENNQLRFKDKDLSDGIPVKVNKFILMQNEPTYDNPYGVPVLSSCYWPYIFKKGGLEYWVQFVEKYGMPWVIATINSNTNLTQDKKEELLDDLDALIADGSSVLTGGVNDKIDIAIKEATKTSSVDVYKSLLHFMNSEISKAILSQTLTTEQGDTGSYAMSQTHLQVRNDIVEADTYMIEDSLLNPLAKLIIQLNFGDQAEYPKVVLYEENDVDKNRAERDNILIQAGIVKNFTAKYIETKYDLNKDDFVVGEGKPAQAPAFSETDPVEDLNEMGLKDFISKSEKMMLPAIELIKKGNSYDEILTKLPELYPDLNTDEIEDLMASVILVSNFSGKVNA